jgi:hypothetical protein
MVEHATQAPSQSALGSPSSMPLSTADPETSKSGLHTKTWGDLRLEGLHSKCTATLTARALAFLACYSLLLHRVPLERCPYAERVKSHLLPRICQLQAIPASPFSGTCMMAALNFSVACSGKPPIRAIQMTRRRWLALPQETRFNRLHNMARSHMRIFGWPEYLKNRVEMRTKDVELLSLLFLPPLQCCS